ncbi:MAG: hypothetical protein C5B48_12535 [Candidatus Rokuibacteriota bacterium]|nr:MAG: hypothetical protein C5B48_12535 [Candidatus Rokubacteria bacterium]
MEARRSAVPATRRPLYFDAFSFDPESGRLTRDGAEVPLGRTAARVLSVLLTHRQRTVTQEEIRRAVWATHVVDRGAVKGYISDLRAILRDHPRAPRLLASVDGGYRFIAAVTSHSPAQRAVKLSSVVGRDDILQGLRNQLARALDGRRRFVFVTGEPGIGKTTTVEVFLEDAEATHRVLVGRGQCVEHSGPGMAYLPLLDALERICGGDEGPRVEALLRQHAPTWWAQLRGAVTSDDRAAVERRVHGATQERGFRELARVVEVLTADMPLVLWLEDLHWCDPETIALLSFLARRTEPARLCIVGTYRPAEVIVHQHPVKALTQELNAQGIAVVLLLSFLSSESIEAYLRHRFGSATHLPVPDLARVLQRRTEGNPLFIVRMLDYAVAQGTIAENADGWRLTAPHRELETLFPASLLDLIARELAQLADGEREVLEAASVVGEEFTMAEVAAALQLDSDLVDQHCEMLVRQRQLLHQGEPEHWPDGTVTIRARFGHTLHRHAIYNQLLPSRKLLWHGRIGACKAAAYGDHPGPIAAELAAHFSRAGDLQRAIHYHVEAGQVALRQQAHHVAAAQYTAALEMVPRLPDTPDRAQQEAEIWMALGKACMAAQGYAAPEVGQAYAQALALCQKTAEAPHLFPTLYGLWGFHLTRGECRTAQQLGERMLSLAQHGQDADLLLQAHQASGLTCYFRGENVLARDHLQQAMGLYDPGRHRRHLFLYGYDPAVVCLLYMAWLEWALGYPDQALQSSHNALSRAQGISDAPSLASATYVASLVHNWRGEWSSALQQAQEAVGVATQHGLPFWIGLGTIGVGWALALQGQCDDGIAEMRHGLEVYQRTGARVGLSQKLMALTEAYGKVGRHEEALVALAEAHTFCEASGELYCAAELARLKGEILLRQSRAASPRRRPERKAKGKPRPRLPTVAGEAEACFHQALDTARRQKAKSWELRAAMSLAELWGQEGKTRDARRLLGDVYGWFTEGFGTADLLAAKRQLAALT